MSPAAPPSESARAEVRVRSTKRPIFPRSRTVVCRGRRRTATFEPRSASVRCARRAPRVPRRSGPRPAPLGRPPWRAGPGRIVAGVHRRTRPRLLPVLMSLIRSPRGLREAVAVPPISAAAPLSSKGGAMSAPGQRGVTAPPSSGEDHEAPCLLRVRRPTWRRRANRQGGGRPAIPWGFGRRSRPAIASRFGVEHHPPGTGAGEAAPRGVP